MRRVLCVFRDKCDIAFFVGIIFSVNPEATFSVVKYHKQIDIHMTPVVTPSAFFNDLSGHAEIGQMLKIIQQHSSSERQLAKEKCEFHTYGRFSVIIHLLFGKFNCRTVRFSYLFHILNQNDGIVHSECLPFIPFPEFRGMPPKTNKCKKHGVFICGARG